jgi:hypothetical protein
VAIFRRNFKKAIEETAKDQVQQKIDKVVGVTPGVGTQAERTQSSTIDAEKDVFKALQAELAAQSKPQAGKSGVVEQKGASGEVKPVEDRTPAGQAAVKTVALAPK